MEPVVPQLFREISDALESHREPAPGWFDRPSADERLQADWQTCTDANAMARLAARFCNPRQCTIAQIHAVLRGLQVLPADQPVRKEAIDALEKLLRGEPADNALEHASEALALLACEEGLDYATVQSRFFICDAYAPILECERGESQAPDTLCTVFERVIYAAVLVGWNVGLNDLINDDPGWLEMPSVGREFGEMLDRREQAEWDIHKALTDILRADATCPEWARIVEAIKA